MRRIFIVISLVLLSMACSFSGGEQTPTEEPSPVSEKRCGDDVCDGPENLENCPEDCSEAYSLLQPADGDELAVPQDADSTTVDMDGYRRVSLAGTMYATLNTSTMGDFTGDAFEYVGTYSIELWFPAEGGKAVEQRNTIQLTEYQDLFFGESDCRPCEWALDEEAYQPLSFDLDAVLTLNGISENDQPADELTIQLQQLPVVNLHGICTCPCPGSAPGDFNDPAAMIALTSWFNQKLVYAVQLNSLKENTIEDFPVSPMYNVDIPDETIFYMMVEDFNQ